MKNHVLLWDALVLHGSSRSFETGQVFLLQCITTESAVERLFLKPQILSKGKSN